MERPTKARLYIQAKFDFSQETDFLVIQVVKTTQNVFFIH